MNDTPSGERTHIGFFGCRNAGKSSLVNAVTGTQLSIVSDTPGTTTDPVTRSMELLPLGPVVIHDTPGLDDVGDLGEQRTRRAVEELGRVDVAVLVVDGTRGPGALEERLQKELEARDIPHLTVYNKCDLLCAQPPTEGIAVSALRGTNIDLLKERLARIVKAGGEKRIAADLVPAGSVCVLVCPIDESAPRGRLILPQQQTIRDLLDAGVMPLVTRETELAQALSRLREPPALVVTDSQAFAVVASTVPQEVPLTSFSILMARYKGFLGPAAEGVRAIRALRAGDRVLMCEGCVHHRQCADIGTVKIPALIRRFTGEDVRFETSSGQDFPADLRPYRLIVHCGGCMLTPRVMQNRMEAARAQGVPFTNYGLAIALMTGTLERSLRPLPDVHARVFGGDN